MSGSTELKEYIVCSFILYLKFVVATGIQATKTFDAGCRPPEDKSLALAQGRREQNYGLIVDDTDAELRKAREIEHRWKRIIQNDLESIPLALLVFLGGVFAGGNKELFVICLAVYTLVRCFHTYAYANMLQPHRAWCWRIGVLMIVTSGVNSIVGVFNYYSQDRRCCRRFIYSFSQIHVLHTTSAMAMVKLKRNGNGHVGTI